MLVSNSDSLAMLLKFMLLTTQSLALHAQTEVMPGFKMCTQDRHAGSKAAAAPGMQSTIVRYSRSAEQMPSLQVIAHLQQPVPGSETFGWAGHLSNSSRKPKSQRVSKQSAIMAPNAPKLFLPFCLMGSSSSKPKACSSYAAHDSFAACKSRMPNLQPMHGLCADWLREC